MSVVGPYAALTVAGTFEGGGGSGGALTIGAAGAGTGSSSTAGLVEVSAGGTMEAQDYINIAGASAAQAGTLVVAGTLSQQDVNPNSVVALGEGISISRGALVVTATGTLEAATITDNGYLDVQGVAGVLYGLYGSGTVRNSGTIVLGAGSASRLVQAALLNDGLIVVGGAASLDVAGAVGHDATRTGTFELASAATLNLDGAVDASQTVLFTDVGVLTIGALSRFAGTVSGLTAVDVIDLAHVAANAASFADGVLTLKDVADTATVDVGTLHLSGAYVTSEFAVRSDGQGGVWLTTTATPSSNDLVQQTVEAGQTYTNAASVVFAGAAAGAEAQELLVGGVYVNNGTVAMAGGTGTPPGPGARLLIEGGGTVDNNGLIQVSPTGSPASLLDLGLLTDAGTIAATGLVAIGTGGTLAVESTGSLVLDREGGTLSDAGVLTMAGTCIIEGGRSAAQDTGALLIVTQGASLDNIGSIAVEAGARGQPGGMGATLSDAGVITNTGTVAVLGSGTDTQPDYRTGTSGSLLIMPTGTFANDGFVSIGGANQGVSDDAATLTVAGVLLNQGSIALSGGTNSIYYPPPITGAVLTVLTTGSLANSGTITLSGGTAGSANVVPPIGAVLVDSGQITDTGAIIIAAGPGRRHPHADR